MKKFLFFLFVAVMSWSITSSCNSSSGLAKQIEDSISVEPPRPKGQTDVIGLRCEPIPVVRIAIIGLGMRGPGAISRLVNIEGVEIKAICDLEPYNIDRAQGILKRNNRPEATPYTGEEGWKKLCERDDVDLVYVCTPWFLHTPMAVYAMEKGKHVAVEVPIARTMDECWQ